jgi:hypothetical protein
MSSFCTHCGSPLRETAKFCSGCGAAFVKSVGKANAAAPVSVAPAPIAPPAPVGQPAKPPGSSAMKVVAVVLGAFVLMGLLALGSCFYLGYRVKQKLKEVASASSGHSGGERSGTGDSGVTGRSTSSSERSPCSLITKEEMSQVLATAFKEASADGSGCDYRGNQPTEWVRVEVDWTDADGQMKAMKVMDQFVAPNLGAPKGFVMHERLPVGDEAYFSAMGNLLMVRKKNTFFSIDLRFFPDAKTKGIALAQKALARIGSE